MRNPSRNLSTESLPLVVLAEHAIDETKQHAKQKPNQSSSSSSSSASRASSSRSTMLASS